MQRLNEIWDTEGHLLSSIIVGSSGTEEQEKEQRTNELTTRLRNIDLSAFPLPQREIIADILRLLDVREFRWSSELGMAG